MAKRGHKRKFHTIRIGETPLPERCRQNGGVVAEVIDRDTSDKIVMQRFRAVAECTLDIYVVKGKLTIAQHKAGMRFRHAYLRAVLRLKVEDSGSGSHGSMDMAALMPIHSERVLLEAYAVLSKQQKAVIIAVCGHDEWVGSTAKGKTLKRALERLTGLWGFG